MDQQFDPFVSNNNTFLKKKKQEKLQKENEKIQIKAMERISCYYQRTKQYDIVKQQVFQEFRSKAKMILELEKALTKQGKETSFYQAASVAVLKYPEILRPLYFMKRNTINHYLYFDDGNEMLDGKATLHYLNTNRQIIRNITILCNNEVQLQFQKFKKAIQLALSYLVNKNNIVQTPIFLNLDYLVFQGFLQLKQKKEIKKQWIRSLNKVFTTDVIVGIYLKNIIDPSHLGFQMLLSKLTKLNIQELPQYAYYLLSLDKEVKMKYLCDYTNQLLGSMDNLLWVILEQGDDSYETMYQLKNIFEKLYIALQNNIVQALCFDVLTKIIYRLELFFFKNKMTQVFKHVSTNSMEEETNYQYQEQSSTNYKSLRLSKEYEQFSNQMQLARFFEKPILKNIGEYLIEKFKGPNNKFFYVKLFSGLSNLITTFISLSGQKKHRVQLKIYLDDSIFKAYQCFVPMVYSLPKVVLVLADMYLTRITLLDDEEFIEKIMQKFSILYSFISNEKIQNEVSINQLARYYLEVGYYLLVKPLTSDMKPCLKRVTQLLSELYMRDDRLHFTTPTFWEIPEANLLLETYTSMGQILQIQQPKFLQDVFTKLPFVFHFDNRIKNLQQKLEDDKSKQNRNPLDLYYINDDGELQIDSKRIIEIRRGFELEDSLDQLNQINVKDLFHVKFFNTVGMEEVGVDGGGITKEFLIRVVNQAFDPHLGLFIETKERTMMPNPHYFQEDLKKYELVGKIIGKAMYEGVIIEPVLARFFLNKVLNVKNSFNELRYYDKDVYQSFVKMKKEKSDLYGLTFTVNEEVYGQVKEVELIKNGANIEVTQENKNEFLFYYTNFRLNIQIEKQCYYFRKGLASVIDPKLLGMFNHKELQLLISGAPQINVKELKDFTKYNGYNVQDKTIQDFWLVLNSFSQQEQQEFLLFVTSCSRAPTLGFKELDPPFCIQKVDNGTQLDLQRLPTTQTCFNIIKLPNYQNIQLLKDKLLQAIKANTGFELT